MTRNDILAAAARYVRERWGDEWHVPRSFQLDEPEGSLCWVARTDGRNSLDGPTSIFVHANGAVVEFTDARTKRALLRLGAARADGGNVIRAYFTPGDRRDDAVLREFIRECLQPSG